MLKDIIEKIENSEALSLAEFENLKRYIKNICRYFTVTIEDIKVVAENISNTLQAYYISVDYSSFEDIIYNNNLEEVAECGAVSCFDLCEVI